MTLVFIIKIALYSYICYKIIKNMDIEKSIKFFLFAGLSILPIAFGLIAFDYNSLRDFQLVKDFGITTSLISISLVYTGVSIIIRLLMISMGVFFKDKKIKDVAKNSPFLEMFYVSCVDAFIYSSIPIIITYYRGGDFIIFVQNSILVWLMILLYFIIWVIIAKNKIKVS